MTELILIGLAAFLIYYVATRLAPKNLLFRLKKEEENIRRTIKEKFVDDSNEKESDFLEKGQEQLNDGKLDLAEKTFISLVKINPREARPYHFLGIIYLRQDEYRGAVEVLKKATELDQLNDTAFNNLGLAYYNLKKYSEAIEAFQKSIQLNDKIAHRYVNLGLSQQGAKELERAALSFESAASIHESIENLTLMTKNYIKLKDEKLSVRSLDRLLRIDPTNGWAKRVRASYK